MKEALRDMERCIGNANERMEDAHRNIVISIGENCLIGANAGTGIPLGDRCTIEAGLYLTANSPVTVLDKNRESVKVVKARNLAGKSDLLFIRDGQSGAITCRTNQNTIELNAELHDLN